MNLTTRFCQSCNARDRIIQHGKCLTCGNDPTGPVPCTIDGCESLKFFAGRCNPCQKVLDAADPVPGVTGVVLTTTWVEECMARQGSGPR